MGIYKGEEGERPPLDILLFYRFTLNVNTNFKNYVLLNEILIV